MIHESPICGAQLVYQVRQNLKQSINHSPVQHVLWWSEFLMLRLASASHWLCTHVLSGLNILLSFVWYWQQKRNSGRVYKKKSLKVEKLKNVNKSHGIVLRSNEHIRYGQPLMYFEDRKGSSLNYCTVMSYIWTEEDTFLCIGFPHTTER